MGFRADYGIITDINMKKIIRNTKKYRIIYDYILLYKNIRKILVFKRFSVFKLSNMGYYEKFSTPYYPSLLLSAIRLEPFPDLQISSWGMSSSLARISITRGEQNPAWHLPIPALVRRLTPSNVCAPSGL